MLWDRFAQDNHNAVILARSGAGKCYLAKLEALRSLYPGIEVAVVDPEDEYRRLAEAVGGAYVHLGAPGVRVNPFDLGARTRTRWCAERCSSTPSSPCCSARSSIPPPPRPSTAASSPPTSRSASPPIRAATAVPLRCWRISPRALEADGDPAARTLAARLAPFVTGTHRGLFDGPTTTRPVGHLVVFSLRDLPGELKAAGTLLTLDAVWRRVSDPDDRKRRLVVVDEAWLLMSRPGGGRVPVPHGQVGPQALGRTDRRHPRRGRPAPSPLGQAVVANAATQILLRQAPQASTRWPRPSRLSAGERAYLLGASRGQGLLAAGQDRVAFSVLASPAEDALARTGISAALDDDA